MTVSTTIKSGDRAAVGSPSQTPCLVGCCSAVSTGTYRFSPGQDVSATLGGGPLADATYYALRQSNSDVMVSVAAQTWSSVPSIVRVGSSGPVVTAATAAGASGPFDDHTIALTVTNGGALGAAQASIAYDGASEIETITLPTEGPAIRTGSVDLNAISYPWNALNGTTLQFTDPSATTVTFGSAPTSAQDVIDDFNTLAEAAPLAVRARLAQGTGSDLGKAFIELYSTAVGTAAAITIDAASTGEALLGLATTTANGTAATLTLPYTGIKLTFPSGTYVEDESYTLSCVGPRASISAITTAATNARNDYQDKPFGFLVVVQPADTASNCKALVDALETLRAAWQADTIAPIFVQMCVGGPWHTKSSTLATNETNIGTTDNALLTAFGAASPALFQNVAPDDVYIPGAASLRSGSFRRTAALAWAIKRASVPKIASDVAEDLVPEASLLGPDNLTRARNEATATTKLGGGSGPGFSALRATSAGLGAPKFSPGATRGGSTSRLRFSGVAAIALEIARLVFAVVELWEGLTLPTDPQTGQLLDSEKDAREGAIDAAIRPTLNTEDDAPLNVSSFSIAVNNPSTGRFIDNGQVPVAVTFVPLGEVEEITVAITAVGTVTITQAA